MRSFTVASLLRELQKRQLRRTDACLLALRSTLDFVVDDGGGAVAAAVTARLGVVPDMLKRQHRAGPAHAGSPRVATADAAFPTRAGRTLRGDRVVVTNEDLRSSAIGDEPQRRAGALSSAGADTHLPASSRDDDRPATTGGIVTGVNTASFASGASQHQAISTRQDLAAPQHLSALLKNTRRLSAASGSGSSARSADNVKGLAGPSGSVISADGNNNNSNSNSDLYKASPRASADQLEEDAARGIAVAQFPSASKMRQILSEIDSHQHRGQHGDEKPAGIMKKPPAAPAQWRNQGAANGNLVGASNLVGSAVAATKASAAKGTPGRAADVADSTAHGPFGAAAAARRAAMGKQVSFIDAHSGDRDAASATLAGGGGALSGGVVGAGSFSVGGHDQPLMLTSRNLEMYTSLLASSALSQPSAAQEDRVSQWVKDHQQPSRDAFRDVAELDEDGASAVSMSDTSERDAHSFRRAAPQFERKQYAVIT